MKIPQYQETWPESWKISYEYDLIEIGEICSSSKNLGYLLAYKNRQIKILSLVKKVSNSKRNEKILDVAAAQGNFSLILAELGYKVTWNDLRSDLIGYVKEKYEFGSLEYRGNNIFDLNAEMYFDIILINEIIEHVAHPDQFLFKIFELVKPGGYVIMSTPNGEYIRNNLPKFSDYSDSSFFEDIQFQPNSDGHIFLLHLDEIKTLSKLVNFEIVEFHYITNPLTNGHIKLGMLLKFLPRQLVSFLEYLTQCLPISFKKKIHTCIVVLLKRPA